MVKKILILTLVVFAVLPLGSFTDSPKEERQKPVLRTVIIDAGHGGSDPGAKGDNSFEKDICLDIVLKLGKKLEAEFPDIKFLYTRTSDTYPTVRTRAEFANRNNGDLFISIHVNAAPKIRHSTPSGWKTQTYYKGKGKNRKKYTRRVRNYKVWYTDNPMNGTETYIWAADRADSKSEAITDRIPEEINDSTEFVPDINDPEFKAKSLLWSKRFFDKSLILASMVEEEFSKDGRPSRGVKQRNWRGIWVLQATFMPSILVETGFITHKDEEEYLTSDKGQNEVSDVVVNALRRYRALTEGKPSSTETSSDNEKPSATGTSSSPNKETRIVKSPAALPPQKKK